MKSNGIIVSFWKSWLIVICLSIGSTAVHGLENQGANELLEKAKKAWKTADFRNAYELSKRIPKQTAVAEAAKLQTLSAYAVGDYRRAIDAGGRLEGNKPHPKGVRNAILWSYIRLGDIVGAKSYAKAQEMLKDGAMTERLRLAQERPLSVKISGTVKLPFTVDALSPYMPGIRGRVDGQDVVIRLDTGGSYVHITRTLANKLGIKHAGSRKSFAGLITDTVSYGNADLELGSISIKNAPVAVHSDKTLASASIAKAFGVDIGPVIGTNLLGLFLTTIDTPGSQLVLSDVNDTKAREEHLKSFGQKFHEVPFGLIGSHLMIARGRMGKSSSPLFIDSGLVAVSGGQQVSVLTAGSNLSEFGIKAPKPGVTKLPWPIALGAAVQDGNSAVSVPEQTWNKFGDWSMVEVKALLSYGFLKKYAWTIDFRGRVYRLYEAADSQSKTPNGP